MKIMDDNGEYHLGIRERADKYILFISKYMFLFWYLMTIFSKNTNYLILAIGFLLPIFLRTVYFLKLDWTEKEENIIVRDVITTMSLGFVFFGIIVSLIIIL